MESLDASPASETAVEAKPDDGANAKTNQFCHHIRKFRFEEAKEQAKVINQ